MMTEEEKIIMLLTSKLKIWMLNIKFIIAFIMVILTILFYTDVLTLAISLILFGCSVLFLIILSIFKSVAITQFADNIGVDLSNDEYVEDLFKRTKEYVEVNPVQIRTGKLETKTFYNENKMLKFVDGLPKTPREDGVICNVETNNDSLFRTKYVVTW